MAVGPTRGSPTAELGSRADREWSNEESEPDQNAGAGAAVPKDRLSRLARTIESDVIPRLVQAHRGGLAQAAAFVKAAQAPAAALDLATVDGFVSLIIDCSDAQAAAAVQQQRERGVSLESLYLELFAPVARQLGRMWEDDTCDFSTVTVALGRLQRLLRELSPAFGTEVDHPANGRRALFIQPRDEQHSFGLSMVAEFFRRDGWDVLGGVGGAVTDPSARVRAEWVDVVGFSVGGDGRLPWLRDSITAVRNASRNRAVVVMVGGPPFVDHPEWAPEVGADATARDGKAAPGVAELLMKRGTFRRP